MGRAQDGTVCAVGERLCFFVRFFRFWIMEKIVEKQLTEFVALITLV
jgi:hypothetical protein